MAEKYGTIPPKFTRAWWDYFWTYYKAYVLTALFIIILAAITIYQVATAPKYDQTVVYAGEITLLDEASVKVEEKLTQLCEDVDKNGEKSVCLQQFNTSFDADVEYATAMLQKLDLMLASDDIYLYITDQPLAERNIGDAPGDSAYEPLENWFDGDYSSLSIYEKGGIVYGIELKDCAVFKELAQETNTDFSGKYIFMRYHPRQDQRDRQLAGYEAAVRLANSLIKG